MSPLPDALSPTPPAARSSPERRWFREPMVWLVIGGPLSVVFASLLSAVVAWKHIDPVITDPVKGTTVGGADDVADYRNPTDANAPALIGRNHASTPRP